MNEDQLVQLRLQAGDQYILSLPVRDNTILSLQQKFRNYRGLLLRHSSLARSTTRKMKNCYKELLLCHFKIKWSKSKSK